MGLDHEVIVKVNVNLPAPEMERVLDDQVGREVRLPVLVRLDRDRGNGVGVVGRGLLLGLGRVLGRMARRGGLLLLVFPFCVLQADSSLNQPLDEDRGGTELGLGEHTHDVPEVYGDPGVDDGAVGQLALEGQSDGCLLREEPQLVLAHVWHAHTLHFHTVPAAHLVYDDVIFLLVLESGVLEVCA